ncbi:hypothetical protein [Pseudomonas guariconensis]|uniref:hypothetical protein n=1 Tax=Pseudomonas guariconensis TaxID=1288410 RepID=UPI002B054D27|nr:hypothetical protein [Pseudomonas guariconensis]
MIASDPYSTFNATRYVFLVIALGLYLPCLNYTWWSIPATALTLLLLFYRSKCIYTSRSYSQYCTYFTFQMFFMFSLLSGAFTFAVGTQHFDWQTSSLAALCSPALTFITIYLISRIKITPPPYEIRNDRVHSTSHKKTTVNAAVWSGVSASGAGALFPLFGEFPKTTLIGSILFPSVIALGTWRTLAGLAQLKSEEKRKGVRYTFSNLEEIQAIRARSWAARLFILLNDAISKPR